MEYHELIRKRFSVRKYTSELLTPGQIDEILMAGNVAPTAKDVQPQRIYVLESREAMAKLSEAIGPMVFGAPNAFIICGDRDEACVRPFDGWNFSQTDATIVTDHMMLAAHDLGLGTCWIGYFDPNVVRETFSIPENEEIYHILIVGHPTEDCVPGPLHAKRKTLSATVRVL
ncbi:MAG: nitroreductase family protein [Candidatus Methanomethylophilaceae archaeon]|nr:nitroreductase family protein [Candidatus Methanomethylophilaceae archaeon]